MYRTNRLRRGWIFLLPCVVINPSVRASDFSITSVGPPPLSDLESNLYLEIYQGGLYPGGVNAPPQPPCHNKKKALPIADSAHLWIALLSSQIHGIPADGSFYE